MSFIRPLRGRVMNGFLPQVRCAHQRLRIVEPLQGSIAKARPRRGDEISACESSPTPWGRNPSLGKLAHAVGTESRLGKACPRCGDGIPAWESLPTLWGRNPSPRKARPRCGDGIPAWESFATLWGRNPSLGKLAHAVGKELQALFLPTPWGRNCRLYFFRFLSMSRFSVSTEAVVVKPSWGVFMQ